MPADVLEITFSIKADPYTVTIDKTRDDFSTFLPKVETYLAEHNAKDIIYVHRSRQFGEEFTGDDYFG